MQRQLYRGIINEYRNAVKEDGKSVAPILGKCEKGREKMYMEQMVHLKEEKKKNWYRSPRGYSPSLPILCDNFNCADGVAALFSTNWGLGRVIGEYIYEIRLNCSLFGTSITRVYSYTYCFCVCTAGSFVYNCARISKDRLSRYRLFISTLYFFDRYYRLVFDVIVFEKTCIRRLFGTSLKNSRNVCRKILRTWGISFSILWFLIYVTGRVRSSVFGNLIGR